MHTVILVLQVILGAFFLLTGITKLASKKQVEEFKQFGYPQGFRILIGLLQAGGGAGFMVGSWLPVIAMLAGIGFTLMMLGALMTHLRVKDPARVFVKPMVCLILSLVVAVWNGAVYV